MLLFDLCGCKLGLFVLLQLLLTGLTVSLQVLLLPLLELTHLRCVLMCSVCVRAFVCVYEGAFVGTSTRH
jgi:hypothetical protein